MKAMRIWHGSLAAAVYLSGAHGAAARLEAQSELPTERATFYLVSHAVGSTDTVVTERSERSANRLEGELRAASGGRTVYTATLASNGLITRLDMRTYRGATDTIGSALSLVVGEDTITARVGTAEPAHLPGAPDVLLIVNPSMASFEQMLIRAQAMGGDRAVIPLFVVGSPSVVPLTVTKVGADSALIEYAGVALRLAVSPIGRLLGGSMPGRQLIIERREGVVAFADARPDYTAPPDAPYTAEDVVVRTPAGLRFTGTLTIPRGRVGGRAPAIVTITGSGSEDRDEQPVAGLKGYRPFRELADTLGRRGIAVLRLDDRGVNGSDKGSADQTSIDYADDIRAGVAYLRARPEIDAARIGLVGHSEGGIIAPIVASTDARLSGIVLMAAPASPGRDILLSQQHFMIDTVLGLTGAQRTAALAQSQRATDSLSKAIPWMKEFLAHDPLVVARTVRTPVLVVQGLTDHQVPSTEADKLAAAFRAGGNTQVTVEKFPATDHLFVVDERGTFDYAKLPSLHVRPEVLTAIADWLSARFR